MASHSSSPSSSAKGWLLVLAISAVAGLALWGVVAIGRQQQIEAHRVDLVLSDGPVYVQDLGAKAWTLVRMPAAVMPWQVIDTWTSNRVVARIRQGLNLRLGRNTRVQFFTVERGTDPEIALALYSGRCWILGGDQARWTVETPSAHIQTIGAVVEVTIDSQGNTHVLSWEGEVRVAGAGMDHEWLRLKPGRELMVSAYGRLLEPSFTLSAKSPDTWEQWNLAQRADWEEPVAGAETPPAEIAAAAPTASSPGTGGEGSSTSSSYPTGNVPVAVNLPAAEAPPPMHHHHHPEPASEPEPPSQPGGEASSPLPSQPAGEPSHPATSVAPAPAPSFTPRILVHFTPSPSPWASGYFPNTGINMGYTSPPGYDPSSQASVNRVTSNYEFTPILTQAHDFLKSRGMVFNRPIEAQLVPARTMDDLSAAQKAGDSYTPNSLYQGIVNGRHLMYMEQGFPQDFTYVAMIHQMVHAWALENCHPTVSRSAIEGMACYMASQAAQQNGYRALMGDARLGLGPDNPVITDLLAKAPAGGDQALLQYLQSASQ